MDYSSVVQNLLKKQSVEIGDRIELQTTNNTYEGVLLPNTGDPDCVTIKLDTGYNIGIKVDEKSKLKKIKEEVKMRGKVMSVKQKKIEKLKYDPKKPTIAVLHTGGTIASRIDYRTGGVIPVFTAEDLASMVPELANVANIRCRMIFQMWSEDLEPEHWQIIAKEIVKEIDEGCDGIIITHGTDYMHYTAITMAFMVQQLPIPVILVGAQRSSDRGSSDAAMNLICAAKFIADSDFSGVALCMHATSNDDYCHILPACKTRKMHTSRRDAFRPINSKPIAKVFYNIDKIEMISTYQKKNPERKAVLETSFNKKVALIKTYPGFNSDQLDFYEKNYEGVVFEGSGMAGNLPINVLDDKTKHHANLLKRLQEMAKKMPLYMTSQCIYGRINMDVYSTGRDMKAIGCQPAYMIPEVALIKLSWILGQTKDPKRVKEMMERDYAGEIIARSELDDFPDKNLEN